MYIAYACKEKLEYILNINIMNYGIGLKIFLEKILRSEQFMIVNTLQLIENPVKMKLKLFSTICGSDKSNCPHAQKSVNTSF